MPVHKIEPGLRRSSGFTASAGAQGGHYETLFDHLKNPLAETAIKEKEFFVYYMD